MKKYDEAVNSLPQKGDLVFVRGEIDASLEPKSEEDIIQAPIHMLKVARLCVEEWSKSAEFGSKVFETLKTFEYSKLDLFQKAVFHVLASCEYKDGLFDIQNANIEWDFKVENWKKEF